MGGSLTAFFMATNDAALKLWYEDKLDAIIKKYVPEDRHQDIGREIVALQDEVEATHGALSIGLFKAMEKSGIPEAGEMMVQGRDTFQEIYQQTLLLIQAISEVE